MTLRSHGHRSTRVLLSALAVSLAAACHEDSQVTTRTVTAWVPAACPVDGKGLATYLALGDYDGNRQPSVHPLSAVGTNLPEVDTRARELVLSASESAGTWEGLAAMPPSGDVNVLVLPHLSPCGLSERVGSRTGSTLAPIGPGRAMIVGGDANPLPPTYVADLTTGAVTRAQPDVQPARFGATVTPFGDGALVAGGVSADGIIQGNAQVYSPALGGFDTARTITLSGTRAHHAAVVLADGRTALIGGSGDAGGSKLLETIDVVDPATSTAQEEGFATLVTRRLDPLVVRLASGEILVAGGKDATGALVTTMEWISFEAGTNELQQPLPWGTAPFTMTALEGGGALVVENTAQSTWVVGAEHGDVRQAPAMLGMLSNPVLFGGAGGAPVLWTGDHFLRWQPWAATWGEFVTLDGATASVQGGIVAPDPGLAIWFDANAQKLVAMRFDTRNAYSELQTGGSVDLANDTSPDELPAPGLVSFGAGTGITVSGNASAFVTDRTYEDVSVHVTSSSAPGMPGACVVLRTTSGPSVLLPDAPPDGGAGPVPGRVLDVKRSGPTVTFSIDGGPFIESATAIGVGERVSVGVRGFPGASGATVTGIRITRPGTP